jgi:hypothetical protein
VNSILPSQQIAFGSVQECPFSDVIRISMEEGFELFNASRRALARDRNTTCNSGGQQFKWRVRGILNVKNR